MNTEVGTPRAAKGRWHVKCASRRRAVTLLEMMLSIGLLVLLVGAMFSFYWTMIRVRDRSKREIEGTQLARVTAQRIASEIRGAMANLPSLGPGIKGREHEIKIFSAVLPDLALSQRRSIRDKRIPAQYDIREIRYYLGFDEDKLDDKGQPTNLGLVRREVKTLRQANTLGNQRDEVDTDLFAPELKYLRFRYFDGVDWVKTWDLKEMGGQNSLPQAVEVIVGYGVLEHKAVTDLNFDESDTDLSPPDEFSTDSFSVVARIPQADTVFFGSRMMRAQAKLGSGLNSGGFGGGLSGGLGGGVLSGGSGSKAGGTSSGSRSGGSSSGTRSGATSGTRSGSSGSSRGGTSGGSRSSSGGSKGGSR